MKSSDNIRAIGIMTIAMVLFTLGDMTIKIASKSLGVGQLLLLLGVLGSIVLGLITRAKGHQVFTKDFFHPIMIWRNLSELVGTLCMFTALSLVDLSMVAAILQATPLVVTMGAAIVLKEKVGFQRWSATILGFIGVVIIMQPWQVEFETQSLWALAGMVGLAMRDLSTRMVPRSTPTLRVATYGMAMLAPAGIVLLLTGQQIQPLDLSTSALIVMIVLFGVLGYIAITAAMRMGEVSVVAPFRYTRMLFALAAGALVFGERPDAWMLLGAAITVLAGLFIFWRESRAKPTNP